METNYITKIEVNRVRHLQEIEIPLSESEMKHLIITGKNGSGKTSLLEAMRLVLLLYCENFTTRDFIAEKLCTEKDALKAQFTGKIFPTAGEIFYTQKTTWQEFLRTVGVEIEIKNFDFKKSQINLEDFIFAYYSADRQYYFEENKRGDKIELKNFYKAYENPGKNFVQYFKDLTSQEALFRIKGDKKNIARADKIKNWLDNVTKILRLIFDNENLTVQLDIDQMKFYIEEVGKNPFSFGEMASGYAAIFDIVADLMMRMENKNSYDLPGIVLIDEVDAHLHLSLQKNILPTLTTLFKNIQFIVTTHSPFVLNSVSNAVVYNLETKTLVNNPVGLSLLPYSGIVEGYFGVSELSAHLKEKFERYKKLAQQKNFSDEDYNELTDLESYLDEIPDFLALDIMADYKQIKFELEQRGQQNG